MHGRIRLNRWLQRYPFMETLPCSLNLPIPMTDCKANFDQPPNWFGSFSRQIPRYSPFAKNSGMSFAIESSIR